MTHHNYIPQYPLNQFIALFTYYKNYTPTHSIDRYLPNGNIEIIIDLTNTPKYIFDNNTLAQIQACKKVWISGLRSEFITIPSGLDAEMFIIEFKKGMAHPFLGKPLTEIANKVVDAELILDPVFLQIRERLLACLTVQKMFILVEHLLIKNFSRNFSVNPFVNYAINRIMSNPAALTIKSVAEKTGYSSKHFINLFSQHVGLSPKTFLRIIRFQKAITEIERAGNINWIALAQDCGYYDQAHFIADFKAFSGFTPVEYTKRKSDKMINYIAVG